MFLATLNAILPAFIIAAIGYVLGKKIKLDVTSISHICLYVLIPSLTFNSLSTSKLDLGTVWKLSLATLLTPLLLWPICSRVFSLLKWDRDFSRIMLLPSIFTNAGNYGLPVCLFAFGSEGMDLGVVFLVTQNVLLTSAGVFIAASSKISPKSALKKVLKMPALYAALAGISVKAFHINLPLLVTRPVELLAQAATSVFLLVLGLQLVGGFHLSSLRFSGVVSFLRLVVGPAVAGILGALLGLRGLPLKILVLEAAMPPPVNSTILAQEFDAYPREVSEVTLFGTVLSIISLPLWMWLISGV